MAVMVCKAGIRPCSKATQARSKSLAAQERGKRTWMTERCQDLHLQPEQAHMLAATHPWLEISSALFRPMGSSP